MLKGCDGRSWTVTTPKGKHTCIYNEGRDEQQSDLHGMNGNFCTPYRVIQLVKGVCTLGKFDDTSLLGKP